jgi:hypothetical protein
MTTAPSKTPNTANRSKIAHNSESPTWLSIVLSQGSGGEGVGFGVEGGGGGVSASLSHRVGVTPKHESTRGPGPLDVQS